MRRPFKAPVYPVTPVVFILIGSYLCLSAIAETPKEASLAGLFVLSSVPVYYLSQWDERRRLARQRGLTQEGTPMEAVGIVTAPSAVLSPR